MGFPPFNPSWLTSGISSPLPDPDGIVTSGYPSNNAGPLGLGPLVTDNSDDLIVLVINTGQAPPAHVSSITSAPSGLTVTRRAIEYAPTQVGPSAILEIWTAPAVLALAGETFTINLSQTMTGACAAIAFGWSGLANINFPFDGNGSLPALGAGSSGEPSVGLSTSNVGQTVLLFFDAVNQSPGDIGAAPVGFTLIGKANEGISAQTYAYYKLVTGVQSGITITDSGSWSTQRWAAIGDALIVN